MIFIVDIKAIRQDLDEFISWLNKRSVYFYCEDIAQIVNDFPRNIWAGIQGVIISPTLYYKPLSEREFHRFEDDFLNSVDDDIVFVGHESELSQKLTEEKRGTLHIVSSADEAINIMNKKYSK